MSDRETVITHLQIIHTWASFARERDLQFFTAKHLDDIAQWTADALALIREQQEQLKAQKEVLDALRKVGYPHNFQRENPWIVNYMWAITDVVKKAVRLNNKIIEPPCDEPPKEE